MSEWVILKKGTIHWEISLKRDKLGIESPPAILLIV